MKRRIAIFCFYDDSGIVDMYVEYLLKTMLLCVKKLVVIINGNITSKSLDLFRKYTAFIYVRSNKGYDGGAYKDALIYFLKDENWKQWDELILFNDTFYGPFYPWQEIFEKMDKKDIDFWGLSRCLGIDRNTSKGRVVFPEHIQSFFLVCRRSMINNFVFMDFWRNLNYPDTYEEAVKYFEVGFSVYFKKAGFKCTSYLDEESSELQIEYNQVIYSEQPYKLITECSFPILKKKALSIHLFNEIREIFEYLKINTIYDIQMILQNIERLDEEDKIHPFSPIQLESFYRNHSKIYIYGHGEWAKGMTEYFTYKGWYFEKYVVTKNTDNFLDTLNYRDVVFDDNDGVILALSEENVHQVYSMIKSDLSEMQIYVPKY